MQKGKTVLLSEIAEYKQARNIEGSSLFRPVTRGQSLDTSVVIDKND